SRLPSPSPPRGSGASVGNERTGGFSSFCRRRDGAPSLLWPPAPPPPGVAVAGELAAVIAPEEEEGGSGGSTNEDSGSTGRSSIIVRDIPSGCTPAGGRSSFRASPSNHATT
ncbi:unnamed protein product, partial [Ectocarpus sp. 12 AP-2014]